MKLNLAPGQRVRIRNLANNEETNFEIRDSFEYRGQYACYAMRIFHEVHMPAAGGYKGAAQGQASWVVLTSERPARELKFIEYLSGLPLAIVDETDQAQPTVKVGEGPSGIPRTGTRPSIRAHGRCP